MGILPREIGEIPEGFENHDGLYLPFPAAVEDDELRESLKRAKRYTPQEAAQYINNGYIPPAGSVIEYPSTGDDLENAGAYDLVAAEFDNRILRIYPTSKEAVDPATHEVRGQGLVVLSLTVERLRPVKVAAPESMKYWLGSRAIIRSNVVYANIDFAARRDFEKKDITPDGVIIATERRRYF